MGRVSEFLERFSRPTTTRMRPVGVMGTTVVGGYIVSDEKNARLTGTNRYKTYSEIIANTSIVAAGTRYFLNLVSMAGWRTEPADHPRGEELAEKIEAAMYDMATPWHRVVRRAAMYRFYGYSIQEWTAKRAGEDNEGEPSSITDFISYRDIAVRPQTTIERWDVDEHGRVYGVLQCSPQDYREIYLPRRKLIYVVDDSLNDSPEGLGVFRHIVRTATELQRFEQLEGYGFEGDLRGIPVGRVPFAYLEEQVKLGNISPDQKTAMIAQLSDFIQNHIKTPQLGLMLDSIPYISDDEAARPSTMRQWDLELLKAANTSQEAVAAAIMRKNREIARVLGVEQLLLGEGAVGSHSLAKDKTQSFAAIVDSTGQELAASFTADFVDPLFLLNGWPLEAKPELCTKAISMRDVLQVTQALKDMASAGAMVDPADPAVEEVRNLLGVSKPLIVRDAPLEEGEDGEMIRTQPEPPPGEVEQPNTRDPKPPPVVGRAKARPTNTKEETQ